MVRSPANQRRVSALRGDGGSEFVDEETQTEAKSAPDRDTMPTRASRDPERTADREPARAKPRSGLRERLESKTVELQDHDQWPFHVPHVDGVAFCWRRYSVNGQEDPNYIAARERDGWEIMQKEDFPEIFPIGMTGPAIRDGLVLMARSQVVHDEAVRRQKAAADAQIMQKVQSLKTAPPGTLPRADVPGMRMIDQQAFMPVRNSGG